MCGIAGVLVPEQARPNPAELAGMAAQLKTRGPDGWGAEIIGNIGLVHTRLAILDLTAAGKQPMSCLDGRYWITFNGEIYNFLELKEELKQHGWTFNSDSDTEVLLKAFIQWGEDCQLKLNGMWAFAIWDAEKRRLFLSRDRFGVKPLHYVWKDGYFAFSSVMKGFLPLPWMDWEVDANAMAVGISFTSRLEGTEECLFKAIRRLPAGHHLVVDAGRPPRLSRWWNTLDHLPTIPDSYEDRRDLVRSLFLDACRIRMRSDVPIATALSGGLDSSSVHCALADLMRHGGGARATSNWQRAYVADYAGSLQSERTFAEAVIAKTGAKGIIEDITVNDVAANADQIIFDIEEVIENISAPWLLYRRMRRDGVVVSLDGHGGDELFIGYHSQLNAALAEITDPALRAEYQEALAAFAVPGYSQGTAGDWAPRASLVTSPPKPPRLPGRDEDLERFNRFDPLTRCAYADLHFTTLPTILRNFDRCSMAHGVEIRAPFMDWRLVCLAFALPPDTKVRNGFGKFILRDALRDLLPPLVRDRRQKMGFVTPVFDWAVSPLATFMRDTAASASFQQSAYWDGPRVRDLLEGALKEQHGLALLYFWPFIHASRVLDLFAQARIAART